MGTVLPTMQGYGEGLAYDRCSVNRNQWNGIGLLRTGQAYPQCSPGKLEPHFSTEQKDSTYCLCTCARPLVSCVCTGHGPWGAGIALRYCSPRSKSSKHCAKSFSSLLTGGNSSITEPWHSQYMAQLRLELHSLAPNSVLSGRENNLQEQVNI